MTSIEPTAGAINDTCIFDRSGLILLALDCSQIPSYFVPALGPAPKWCSYLENFTEEMEEGAQTTIYDDFKFLTKEDLKRCVWVLWTGGVIKKEMKRETRLEQSESRMKKESKRKAKRRKSPAKNGKKRC